jgi:transcriptional regulator with XRE-family HTH domain
MVKRPTIHLDPTDLPAGAPTDAVKMDFARRLQRAMVAKGWNQSELARRAAKFAPEERFIRDNVSKYMRGKVLPGPVHLSALCKALGMKPDDLLPTRGLSGSTDAVPFSVTDAGDGQMWLRINMAVSWDVAMKVQQLLRGNK